ncbi:carbohydrate ABC transporter permease [Cohnella sp. LGH]|uniref:Raffinose/stachyose/melibiose transport system permease protein n=1 Tax=Cohnella phaseoli TaxID=456490 RepID=A0A3D9I3J7_9BACL|nr:MULTISPECIES: carbohydrate ABC transporter permease [Cohnella]QTH40483.1 carbohydrate ABC transporter permease [Cohnella sp. LGH]RED56215.1 raffinose/stachyose/melibiose transport system permease protein [Cohnella phaseoli]
MKSRSLPYGQIALIAVISAMSLLILVPFYLIFINSLKSPAEASELGLAFPSKLEWSNYSKVFEVADLPLAFTNSIVLTFSSVAIILISAAMAAFVIQRRKDGWSAALNVLVMLGLVVPPAIVPLYKVLSFFHLNGTILGVVLINVATRSPLSVFLANQFLKSISKEIDEAAIIDGCGKYKLFFRIVLPLMGPIMVTLFIFNSTFVWNDFMYVLYFLSSGKQMTLPLTMYLFTGQFGSMWNLVFANILIISAPLLIIYFFAQRFIIAGMTAGAIKG